MLSLLKLMKRNLYNLKLKKKKKKKNHQEEDIKMIRKIHCYIAILNNVYTASIYNSTNSLILNDL